MDRGCKELLQGVVDGARSADSLIGLTASTLKAALQEQKGAISAWHHEVGGLSTARAVFCLVRSPRCLLALPRVCYERETREKERK